MSLLSPASSKHILKLFLVSIWFGILSYLFLFLLPLFILDCTLISFWFVIWISVAVSFSLFCAIGMYPRMDMDRLLSRSCTYMVLLAILFSLYAILLATLNRFSVYNQAALAEYFLYFLLATALIFYPLRKVIQNLVNRLFFKHLPDYRTLLCNFGGRIASSLYLPDLVELLISELPERLRIAGVGLMIMEEKCSRLYPENLRFGTHLWSQSRLINLLRDKHHFFFCKPIANDPDLSAELLEIRNAGFAMVFGLQGGSQFGGMLLFGPKKDGGRFSNHDVQIFSILANHVIIGLENALNYESLSKSKNQLQQVNDLLVQAQKMATLGEMTAILAHELRNPLGIIRSSAQFLVSGNRKPEMQRELLHYIVDEVDSLNLVINNLLGLARQKPPRFRKVDLKKEMINFVSRWKHCDDHSKNVAINLSFPEHIPVLYCDFKQLEQVLLNCIANSEEAMPDGGRISISIRELDSERIEIVLTDTGPGLAEDDLKLVFKKFFTTKTKGVGLGLPVCRQIVRAHNGSITLVNNKERGTSVLIHLPLRPLVSIGRERLTSKVSVSTPLEEK